MNTLYLQNDLGLSPLRAGIYLLPMAVATMLVAPVSGRLVGTRGTRLPLLIAGLAMTAGAVLLTGIDHASPDGVLLAGYLLFGIGFGMVNAPITNTAVSGMPNSQAGVAAAVASTSRQVGGALGVAVVGSAYTSRLAADGSVSAAHVGWWIVAGCTLVVLGIGLLTSGGWAAASAARAAQRLSGDPAPSPVALTTER